VTATVCLIAGFVLAVLGIALWSLPAACLVAGVTLFISGGLEHRQQAPRK